MRRKTRLGSCKRLREGCFECDGGIEQSIRVAVSVDSRETLEIPHTFRNCVMPPLMLDLAPELANGDTEVQICVDDFSWRANQKMSFWPG